MTNTCDKHSIHAARLNPRVSPRDRSPVETRSSDGAVADCRTSKMTIYLMHLKYFITFNSSVIKLD